MLHRFSCFQVVSFEVDQEFPTQIFSSTSCHRRLVSMEMFQLDTIIGHRRLLTIIMKLMQCIAWLLIAPKKNMKTFVFVRLLIMVAWPQKLKHIRFMLDQCEQPHEDGSSFNQKILNSIHYYSQTILTQSRTGTGCSQKIQ